jgi:heme oxygenase
MNTLRHVLREETSDAHTQLDKALISYDLSQKDGLAKYLTIHHLARQHLTKMLSGLEDLRDDLARLEDLSMDLSTLGAPLPSWIITPDKSPKHPLGLIYVMAGSSLGSKILYKNWESSTDSSVKSANRFVTNAKNNDIWKRFLAYIERNEFSREETEDIISAANFCFTVFEAANNQLKSTAYDR